MNYVIGRLFGEPDANLDRRQGSVVSRGRSSRVGDAGQAFEAFSVQ